jgi:AraC family transcriptional regulator
MRAASIFPINNSPRWLQPLKEILHANFSENSTLNCLAELVGVHPVYLAAAFRKCYRCTICDCVRRLRVEYACREVLNSDLPLVEIACPQVFPVSPTSRVLSST